MTTQLRVLNESEINAVSGGSTECGYHCVIAALTAGMAALLTFKRV